MEQNKSVNLNETAFQKAENLIRKSDEFKITVEMLNNGVRIIDAGVKCFGSSSAGVKIAEICMGGIGEVRLECDMKENLSSRIFVSSSNPVTACLASQYAGWSLGLKEKDNFGKAFNCLGSGPARVKAKKEKLIADLGVEDNSNKAVLVMEVDSYPPKKIISTILEECGVNPENLILIITPTTSFAGTIQVVSRVLEVALHKLHELKFPLESVEEGFGSAPIPLPANDFLTAMGRTNDAILYGGLVNLTVNCTDSEAQILAQSLPSCNSEAYGKSFSKIFESVSYDFYKIDPLLFAPAKVVIGNKRSGKSWVYGKTDFPLLENLWIKKS